MALNQPSPPEPPEPDRPNGRGRKAARWAVPVAVAGIAAATIGLVPALADPGAPALPRTTAEHLIADIAGSDVTAVDGTVQVSVDLGLPSALSAAPGSLLSGGADGTGSTGQGSAADPQRQLTRLLAGSHQLRVAADGPDRQKLSLVEPAAEYSVIRDGTRLWAYDSASNQVFRTTLPARDTHAGTALPDAAGTGDLPATPQEAARQLVRAARGTASFTVGGTERVAGRSAYDLVVTPEHAAATTVGKAVVAVDAENGLPLKVTVDAKGGGKPVVQIRFTKVGFARPAASTFTFTPPKGAEVTEGRTAASRSGSPALRGAAPRTVGSGWDTVAVVDTGAAQAASGGHKPPSAALRGFGSRVDGAFGSGTLFHTRLLNALLTDEGTLYVGAVSPSALTAAANGTR
jgi:outer membrane lipoprotein-sorting protein